MEAHAKALVGQNVASWEILAVNHQSARRNHPQLVERSLGTVRRGYEFASGRPKWPNKDPIEEDGGLNMYASCSNNKTNFTDILGLESQRVKTRNCTEFAFAFDYNFTRMPAIRMGPVVARPRGRVNASVEGQSCDACCSGSWVENGYESITLGKVTGEFVVSLTFGLDNDFDIPGATVRIRVGIGGDLSGGVSGGGSIETVCGASSGKLRLCFEAGGDVGAMAQVQLVVGPWRLLDTGIRAGYRGSCTQCVTLLNCGKTGCSSFEWDHSPSCGGSVYVEGTISGTTIRKDLLTF